MRGGEEMQLGQVTQANIPNRMTSWSVYESEHKKEIGCEFGVMMFIFPSHCYG